MNYVAKREQKQGASGATLPAPAGTVQDLRPHKHITQLYDSRSLLTTPIQLKSQVTNQGQYYTWGHNQKTLVGHTMTAYLDPDNPIRGQAASLNTGQNEMMHWIKSHHHLKASGAVKGHLLNDNLGGTALNVNLFPITKAANAVHLHVVENYIKNQLWSDETPAYYYVEAKIGDPDKFECEIGDWNMKTNKISNVKTYTVESHLGQANDMDMANPDDSDYTSATYSNSEAEKKKMAFKPFKKVSELSDTWASYREDSETLAKLHYETT